jgi:hypothetical protein
MTQKVIGTIGRVLMLGLIGGALVMLPAGVAAKQGDVVRTGSCSNNSDWKLKLSPENGKIEVEFEVDTPKIGQTWNVTLRKNGNVFFQGSRTTKAPSGSFTVRRLTGNPAGTDSVTGRAVNQKTGEVCLGSANF